MESETHTKRTFNTWLNDIKKNHLAFTGSRIPWDKLSDDLIVLKTQTKTVLTDMSSGMSYNLLLIEAETQVAKRKFFQI